MGLTKDELLCEAVFDVVMNKTKQTLDKDSFATYTFTDDEREDLVLEVVRVTKDIIEGKDVFDMSEGEFKEVLSEKTTPEGVFVNAGRIYDFLAEVFKQSCADSVLREWAFQWYSEQTGDSYDNIYNKWLEV